MKNIHPLSPVGLALLAGLIFASPAKADDAAGNQGQARVGAEANGDDLILTWEGDERIQVILSKSRGLFKAPFRVKVGDRVLSVGGFYVHLNHLTNDFTLESTQAEVCGKRIEIVQMLRHPRLTAPTRITFSLRMEPQDCGLRVEVGVEGKDQHLDRLGLEDHAGAGLAAQRMFFGRMYVLDKPQAFQHEHNYNTCRFWCWTMANGLTELQATGGAAKGFRFDPDLGRYDLFTYCQSPINYLFFFTAKGPNEAVAQYRRTIKVPAPPTLAQLPGRVGVMTAYSIGD